MYQTFYSIIVVCLNPGERLFQTLESILGQTETAYEVIVKDGGSVDGSIELLEEELESGQRKKLKGRPGSEPKEHIRLVRRSDKGIYDAMNQAVKLAGGRYLYFLNCGDVLYGENVLERMKQAILEKESGEALKGHSGAGSGALHIFYGNQYNRLQDSVVYSAPAINDFTCYRNVPCHQVCFYEAPLFAERAYDTAYRVRADYEHFLYCIYTKKAVAAYVPLLVTGYEGGGFSETKANRQISEKEHKEITRQYLGAAKARKYRLLMLLTLAPLRTRIAESPALSGGYNRVKAWIYGRKG